MKFPSYTTRADAIAPVQVWTLYPDHIAIRTRHTGFGADAPETVEKVNLNQMKRVELQWNPKKRLYSCELTLQDGRQMVFFNRTWTDDQKPLLTDNEYVLFVPNLLKALGRESLECAFISGTNPFRYFRKLFLTSAFLGFWLGLIGFFGVAGVIWVSIGMIGVVFVFVPRTLRWFRSHQPDEFSPSHIPPRLLPRFKPVKA